MEPQPLELIKDGKPIRENMAEEEITDEELAAQLRGHGIDNMVKVKLATMESEGSISVIPKEETGSASVRDPPGKRSPRSWRTDEASGTA